MASIILTQSNQTNPDEGLGIYGQNFFILLIGLSTIRIAYSSYLIFQTYCRWKRSDCFSQWILWLSLLQCVLNLGISILQVVADKRESPLVASLEMTVIQESLLD